MTTINPNMPCTPLDFDLKVPDSMYPVFREAQWAYWHEDEYTRKLKTDGVIVTFYKKQPPTMRMRTKRGGYKNCSYARYTMDSSATITARIWEKAQQCAKEIEPPPVKKVNRRDELKEPSKLDGWKPFIHNNKMVEVDHILRTCKVEGVVAIDDDLKLIEANAPGLVPWLLIRCSASTSRLIHIIVNDSHFYPVKVMHPHSKNTWYKADNKTKLTNKIDLLRMSEADIMLIKLAIQEYMNNT